MTNKTRSFLILVVTAAVLLAGVMWNANAAYAAITSSGNAAVQYADSHWNWDWYDPNNHSTVSEWSWQPNFQCAEFVARALAAEGLLPGLSATSPQSAFGNYNGYDLLDVGVPNIPGLYDYLINSGLGVDVGDSPSYSVPGDVVFYYNGSVTAANREHTALLVATGTTVGGNDTLIDAHNAAEYHESYANMYFNNIQATRTIVHITTHRCVASPSEGNCNNQDYSAEGCNDYPQSGAGSNAYVVVTLHYSTNCLSNWASAKIVGGGFVLKQVRIERGSVSGGLGYLSLSDYPWTSAWYGNMIYSPNNPARACAWYGPSNTNNTYGPVCSSWV